MKLNKYINMLKIEEKELFHNRVFGYLLISTEKNMPVNPRLTKLKMLNSMEKRQKYEGPCIQITVFFYKTAQIT